MQVSASTPPTPGDRAKAMMVESVKWGALAGAGAGLVTVFVGPIPGLTRPQTLLLSLVGAPLLGAAAGAVAGLAGIAGFAADAPRSQNDYIGTTAGSIGLAGMAAGVVGGGLLAGKHGALAGGLTLVLGAAGFGGIVGNATWNRLHPSSG